MHTRRTRLSVVILALIGMAAVAAGQPANTTNQTQNVSVDHAFLVADTAVADASVSASAATRVGAPVITTGADELSASAAQQLGRVAPERVTIVGGPEAVSQNISETLIDRNVSVTRLWGITQYGSAVDVAEFYWPDGADEAVVVENTYTDPDPYRVSLAGQLAAQRGVPLYIVPEGGAPTIALMSMESLGVSEIAFVGDSLSEDQQTLFDRINITVADRFTAGDEGSAATTVKDEVLADLSGEDEVLAVAADDPSFYTASTHTPGTTRYIVRNKTQITGLTDMISVVDTQQAVIVGEDPLATATADAVRNTTDATVGLQTFTPDQSGDLNAALTMSYLPRFATLGPQRMTAFEDAMTANAEQVQGLINASITRAERFGGENISAEAETLIEEARSELAAKNYMSARTAAQAAYNVERLNRYAVLRADGGFEALLAAIEAERSQPPVQQDAPDINVTPQNESENATEPNVTIGPENESVPSANESMNDSGGAVDEAESPGAPEPSPTTPGQENSAPIGA